MREEINTDNASVSDIDTQSQTVSTHPARPEAAGGLQLCYIIILVFLTHTPPLLNLSAMLYLASKFPDETLLLGGLSSVLGC
jgi:hypothetical protein